MLFRKNIFSNKCKPPVLNLLTEHTIAIPFGITSQLLIKERTNKELDNISNLGNDINEFSFGTFVSGLFKVILLGFI